MSMVDRPWEKVRKHFFRRQISLDTVFYRFEENYDGGIGKDLLSLTIDTFSSGLIGGIGGAIISIRKINAMNRIYKSGLTKNQKYGYDMSYKIMAKGFAAHYISGYGDMFYSLSYNIADDIGWL